MTPKPDARVAPSQDEFDSWCQHPCTMFVAEAYRIGAIRQREEWEKQFDARLIPADIALTRLELKTREDAYRAFLETTLVDYLAIVAPTEIRRPSAADRQRGQHQDHQRRPQPRQDRRGAA